MNSKQTNWYRAVAPLVILGLLTAACASPASPAATQATVATSAPLPTATSVLLTATPAPGGTFKFGMASMVPSYDPQTATGGRQVFPTIFDTLIYQAPDGSFIPGLAMTWTVSTDGLNWTFHLKDGVTFHDGTPFDAAAVKFNFDRIANPATKATYALNLIGPFESATVIDPLTVEFKLSKPFPPFEINLTRPFMGMVSPTAVTKLGQDFGLHPVGTGPFIFKEYVPNDHLTVTRNPNYTWGPAIFHTGPAYLQEITFIPIPENATRLTALQTGEVTAIERVPESDYQQLASNPKITTTIATLTGMPLAVFINVERPATSDLKVRQALEYAFDRNSFIKAHVFNVYSPVSTVFAPGVLYRDATAGNQYSFDTNRATADGLSVLFNDVKVP